MVVRQHALTVVGRIRNGAEPGLRAILRDQAASHDLLNAFERLVPTLHFGRFVIVASAPGDALSRPARLVFESNYDGDDLALHLAQLASAMTSGAGWEEAIFGAWDGYEKGGLPDFVARHAVPASTYYLGHPGLPVARIRKDEQLRLRLGELLDAEHEAHRVKGTRPAELRTRLLAALARDDEAASYELGPFDRGTPRSASLAKLRFALVLAPPVLLALTTVLWLRLVVEPREQKAEAGRMLITEDDPILQRIALLEDAASQNGLTHYVALRPGPYRRTLMKLVLFGVELARQFLAYEGTLGGISTIHFARWIMLPDDSVLFFSNYDGSWESYLGDFVDKAHLYLSAVWSSTRWFPKTAFLAFGGAQREADFKQWTRTCQLENQLWYSAYRNLSVAEVHRNAQLREGAVGAMNDDEARAWLARI
ncbi:MAG: Peroxidase [Labilithrix sp.]|nr:Peroxidase [Labilithrix sp.]